MRTPASTTLGIGRHTGAPCRLPGSRRTVNATTLIDGHGVPSTEPMIIPPNATSNQPCKLIVNTVNCSPSKEHAEGATKQPMGPYRPSSQKDDAGPSRLRLQGINSRADRAHTHLWNRGA